MDNQFKKKNKFKMLNGSVGVRQRNQFLNLAKFGQSLATLVSEDFFINCINF